MPRILRLDRMEILGFKSFYGRTRFDFPDGITAVVGPNGCGKSNIGDAISWVLGEQKASSLRSDRMEDVIFNGSEGRRPLGMAEVSLHFKNLLPGGNGHAAGGNGGNGHHLHGAAEETAPAAVSDAAVPPPTGPETVEPSPVAPVPAEAACLPGDDHALPIPAAMEAPPASMDDVAGAAVDGPPLRITGIEEIPDEVVVTRRIYRSGESEYILNGERCRLRDIQDLLARTDIGSRLYSTIEQGKIDQVLVARPKDRRAMFEEAAGILGYRSKRRQAELKLEATQANLLRINDIVVEVEKQMQALRRQAAKARRYQRLIEDQRDKRRLLARHRLASVDRDQASAGAAIETLRAEEMAAAATLATDEADLERLRLRLEAGEEAGRRRREEIHAFDLEIDRLQERLRSGEEQTRELRGRVTEGETDLQSLEARLSEQDLRRVSATVALSEVEDLLQHSESQTALVEQDDRDRAAAIAILETEIESLRAALLERVDRIAALERRRTLLEEQARAAGSALEQIERDATGQSAERQRLAAEIEALRDGMAAGRDRARLAVGEEERSRADEIATAGALAEAERGAEELKGRAAILSERLETLAEMERQHAGFSEGVGDILRGTAGVETRGVVGERLEVPRGLEKAVEAALGDLLEALVVEGTGEAVRGVDYLRGNSRGRGSFVPPDGDEEGAAADAEPASLLARIGGVPAGPVARILERTILVASLEEGLRLHRERPERACVTPEGDIVRADGAVTGGDGRALQHWLLERRAERVEIARRMDELSAARREAEEALVRLRGERTAAQDRLRFAAAAVQEEARRAFETELRLQQAQGEMERIDRALPLLASEQGRRQREITDGRDGMAVLAIDLEAAEGERREMEETRGVRASELALRRTELERLRRESAEARATVAAAVQRRASLQREIADLDESLQGVRADIARRHQARDECTARLQRIAEQEGELARQRDQAMQTRAEAAAADETAHAGLAYERGLLHARDQAAKDGRAAQADLRDRQRQHELQQARLSADLEHLERTCRDELSTTLETLRADPEPPADGPGLAEREAEMQKLRADLEAIGPVNLMAVEQQTDLEERFRFLTAQKTDLEQAIASLRDTIRTINREARERFRSAFEAIQGHFQTCFTTLFGGGRAELRLQEDEEDVLEAGVEIVAQPPGKRLQKLALLSGGEKALTAMALLVSLFRYRPSPFCILDEVDAPLDEANVGRFTQLLQQLRSDTQFILITHNRKSMEAADLLYGVTMEEPGVSKILPLRFE